MIWKLISVTAHGGVIIGPFMFGFFLGTDGLTKFTGGGILITLAMAVMSMRDGWIYMRSS